MVTQSLHLFFLGGVLFVGHEFAGNWFVSKNPASQGYLATSTAYFFVAELLLESLEACKLNFLSWGKTATASFWKFLVIPRGFSCKMPLAAQREIPPHIVQYPFEIVSQGGGYRTQFALFSQVIAQVSLRYPF